MSLYKSVPVCAISVICGLFSAAKVQKICLQSGCIPL